MKNTIKIIVLSIALLLGACSADKPNYDFSSVDNLLKSVESQAKKEGLSKEDEAKLGVVISFGAAAFENDPDNKKYLKALKKEIQGKTLKSLVDEFNKKMK